MTPLVSGSNKAMIDPISGALSYGPISSGFPSSTNVKTVFCTASIANAFMSPVSTSSNALVNVTSFVGNGKCYITISCSDNFLEFKVLCLHL